MIPFSVRFAIENLMKNRGRSLACVMGILLAITLIGGANISVDRAGRSATRAVLRDLTIDLILWDTKPMNSSRYLDQIEAWEDVTFAETAFFLSNDIHFEGGESDPYGYGYRFRNVMGVPQGFSYLGSDLGIGLNRSDLADWEILISDWDLRNLIDIEGRTPIEGETINLSFHGREARIFNFTFAGTFILDRSTFRKALGYLPTPSCIVNLETCGTILEEVGTPPHHDATFVYGRFVRVPTSAHTYLVKLDRAKTMDFSDIDRTIERMRAEARQIIEKTDSDLDYFLPIEMAAERYRQDLEWMRGVYLLASLPLMIFGIYLAIMGMNLVHQKRRVEIGILKCRGLSRGQIWRVLLVESAILGAVAGCIGLLFGSFVAWMMIPLGAETSQGVYFPSVSWVSLLVSMLLGIGAMLMASIRPIRRLSRMDITESLTGYSRVEATIPYSPRTDLVLIGVPIAIYGSILAGARPEQTWTLTGQIFQVLFQVGLALMPITPIMLCFGVARLLTRSSGKPYTYLSRMLSPLIRGTGWMVTMSLERNPRRSSAVAVLVSLSIAFGILVTVLPSSQKSLDEAKAEFRIGADIQIVVRGALDDSDLLSRIGAVEGVKTLTIIHTLRDASSGTKVCLVEPERLAECIDKNPFFGSNERQALEKLVRGEGLALIMGKDNHVSGTIQIGPSLGIPPIHLRLAGSFQRMPGVRETLYKIPGRTTILANREYFDSLIDLDDVYSSGVIIRVEEDAEIQAVEDRIRDLSPTFSKGGVLRTVEDTTDLDVDIVASTIRLSQMEFAFALIMASFGVGLIMYFAEEEREPEIAQLRARGLSKGQAFYLLAGEGTILILLGLFIGILAGSAPSILYISSLAKNEGLTITAPITIPIYTYVILLVAPASIFCSSLTAAVKARRIQLTRVLRMRLSQGF